MLVPRPNAVVCANLDREIHVWSVLLDQSEPTRFRYDQTLDAADHNIVNRYSTAQLRDRHTVATGALKSLLASYSGEKANEIKLKREAFGKPILVSPENSCELQFSASHSSDVGVYVFTQARLIGVDVEEIVEIPDLHDVMTTCLTDYEIEWLSGRGPTETLSMFYQLWTIKEAFLKALGTGLSISPKEIELGFTEENSYQFRRIPGEPNASRQWEIVSFAPVPGFCAALVSQASSRAIVHFTLEPKRHLDAVFS